MKLIFLLSCLLAVGWCYPADVAIVRYENVNHDNGGYHFLYETSDGSSREEDGHIINPGTENAAVAVKGSYSYLGSDGVQYTVHYVADENGFQPQGAHIPTPGQVPIVAASGFKRIQPAVFTSAINRG